MQEYNSTDQLLHSLSQFIAKMNRQFLDKKEDDSHINLYFDPLQGALLSHWLKTDIGSILFRLNLVDWSFEFLDSNFKLLHRIDLQLTKFSDLEAYITYGLELIGLDKKGYSDPMHFEIPDYRHDDDALKKTNPFQIEEWMTYRSLANTACYQILGSMQSKGEVRIWPHHFDTGIYLKLSDQVMLGFGLAMHDDNSKNPYFYASAYNPQGDSLSVDPQENVLAAGKWINTEGFKAAILDLKEVKYNQEDLLQSYLRSFLKIYLSLP